MAKVIRKIIANSKAVSEIVNIVIRKKNEKIYNRARKELSGVSLFDIEKLAKDFPYYPTDHPIDNHLYGISATLKKFAGFNRKINAFIEHGVFWGEQIQADSRNSFVPSIITFSNTRKEHLIAGGIRKRIEPIGPYIWYADGVIGQQEFSSLKNELGKVLLVYPPHSTKNLEMDYSINAFIRKIEELRSGFDTVVVSLYFIDVYRKELLRVFRGKGYKIVTSGHRFDPAFSSRQRTIIDLSDFTMSSSVGTHVGYCVALGKPHYICDVEIGRKPKTDVGDHFLQTGDKLPIRLAEKGEVHTCFSKYSATITQNQIDIVDKYWGLKKLKTREQLSELLTDIMYS